jgi:hypothetical protein
MSQRLQIGLSNPGLYSAAGLGVENVWEALRTEHQPTEPGVSLLSPGTDTAETFAVPDPDAATLGVHRKTLRTTAKQTRLAMYGAQLSLHEISDLDGPEWGLFLGLPTVLNPLVPKNLLPQQDEIALSPAEVAELYLRELPPFFALTDSNNIMAGHIAIRFGITGPTAVYSPFSDAGMQALIDGALAVAENDCDKALVGAASPQISPWQAMQYQDLGWNGASAPGEAAAFLVAEHGGEIALTGYSRAFAAGPTRREVVADTLRNAIQMAGLSRADVGWVLADSSWTDEVAQAQHTAIGDVFGDDVPVFSTERAIGITGPAQPLVHVLLARHGLLNGLRLVPPDDGSRNAATQEALPRQKAVVTLGCGVHGQVAAVVLERFSP